MARLTITLSRDGERGGLEIRVALRSDEDVLPDEHQRLHRELVERLLPSLDSGGSRSVQVQRERPAREPVVG